MCKGARVYAGWELWGKEERLRPESKEKQVICSQKGRCVLFKALIGSEGDKGRR